MKSSWHKSSLASAILLTSLGVAVLPFSAWYWINSDASHARNVDRLVAKGNIERAVELVKARDTWSVLADSLREHEIRDYRPVLDGALGGPDMLLFFERQLAADVTAGIEYALQQKDRTAKKLLLQRVLANEHPHVPDEVLIESYPQLFVQFLELRDSREGPSMGIEDRFYTCAMRALGKNETELAETLLSGVQNALWRVQILTGLGCSAWKAGDEGAARKYFAQAIRVADECEDVRTSLHGFILLASRLLALTTAQDARELLDEAKNVRYTLKRSEVAREDNAHAGMWVSQLSDEVFLWRVLGDTAQVNRITNDAQENIRIGNPRYKQAFLDAWEHHQANAPELRRFPEIGR
jgi:hypothetical protein